MKVFLDKILILMLLGTSLAQYHYVAQISIGFESEASISDYDTATSIQNLSNQSLSMGVEVRRIKLKNAKNCNIKLQGDITGMFAKMPTADYNPIIKKQSVRNSEKGGLKFQINAAKAHWSVTADSLFRVDQRGSNVMYFEIQKNDKEDKKVTDTVNGKFDGMNFSTSVAGKAPDTIKDDIFFAAKGAESDRTHTLYFSLCSRKTVVPRIVFISNEECKKYVLDVLKKDQVKTAKICQFGDLMYSVVFQEPLSKELVLPSLTNKSGVTEFSTVEPTMWQVLKGSDGQISSQSVKFAAKFWRIDSGPQPIQIIQSSSINQLLFLCDTFDSQSTSTFANTKPRTVNSMTSVAADGTTTVVADRSISCTLNAKEQAKSKTRDLKNTWTLSYYLLEPQKLSFEPLTALSELNEKLKINELFAQNQIESESTSDLDFILFTNQNQLNVEITKLKPKLKTNSLETFTINDKMGPLIYACSNETFINSIKNYAKLFDEYKRYLSHSEQLQSILIK
jgi:hypothetical protein